MELIELDFDTDTAIVAVSDGDDWTAYQACFLSTIFYEEISFDHAFGTHTEGSWELHIDNLTVSAVEDDGKVLPCDTDKLLSLMYQAFYDNYKRYIPDYMEVI